MARWTLRSRLKVFVRGWGKTLCRWWFWDGSSLEYQGLGIGFGMLQDAISRTLLMAEQAGIRALLTHPIDEEATRFYTRFGCIASPLREQQSLLLLKAARRSA